MKHEFTANYERDGDWHIAYCPEIAGASGQGRTKEEACQSLAEALGASPSPAAPWLLAQARRSLSLPLDNSSDR
jgi:hypothetical protein